MNEMQRICGEKWLSTAQVKWDELKHKIIGQADLEASHKTKLKEVLEGDQKMVRFAFFINILSTFFVARDSMSVF